MTCTFFGHRDAPAELKNHIFETLVDCIENSGVDTFYVGNQGHFDSMIRSVLRLLQEKYDIRYYVVLAYSPYGKNKSISEEYTDTIFPEELATVPARFAIDRRNRWLLENSEIVITYVTRGIGGAAKFEKEAQKKGKTIIRLAKQ